MQGNPSEGPVEHRPLVGEVERVSKTFGETRALIDVSLGVSAGECHGLVGRNGAGKSTLVSLMTGLSRPDHGTIRWPGNPHPGSPNEAAGLERVAAANNG